MPFLKCLLTCHFDNTRQLTFGHALWPLCVTVVAVAVDSSGHDVFSFDDVVVLMHFIHFHSLGILENVLSVFHFLAFALCLCLPDDLTIVLLQASLLDPSIILLLPPPSSHLPPPSPLSPLPSPSPFPAVLPCQRQPPRHCLQGTVLQQAHQAVSALPALPRPYSFQRSQHAFACHACLQACTLASLSLPFPGLRPVAFLHHACRADLHADTPHTCPACLPAPTCPAFSSPTPTLPSLLISNQALLPLWSRHMPACHLPWLDQDGGGSETFSISMYI